MYVNGMPFMDGIDTTIKYLQTEPLLNMHTYKPYQVLYACIHVYNHAGHAVTEIRRDQQFATIMDTIRYDIGVHMNYTYVGEHGPVENRKNRMVKDSIRLIFHYLPLRMIPNLMVRKLTNITTKCLNWFPLKGVVSP